MLLTCYIAGQVYQGDGVLVNVDAAVRRGRTIRWAAQHDCLIITASGVVTGTVCSVHMAAAAVNRACCSW